MQKSLLLRRVPQYCLSLIGCLIALSPSTQVVGDIARYQLQRQQQREEIQRRQDEATPDVCLQSPTLPKPAGYPTGETPCFVIRQLKLGGDEAERVR